MICKRAALAATVAAAAALAGCVSTNSTLLGAAKPGPRTAFADVQIYRTAAQAPAGYREIALIHATADAGFTNESRMYRAMRREAAKLGADGVILDGLSDYGSDRQGRGIAIARPD